MSIIQWRLVEKATLPQNDTAVEMATNKVPLTARDSFTQPSIPVSLNQPLDELAASENLMDGFSPSFEMVDDVEHTVKTNEEQNEEQSEGSSLDPGEPNCEEPPSEMSEEQSESTVIEDQQENSPVSYQLETQDDL